MKRNRNIFYLLCMLLAACTSSKPTADNTFAKGSLSIRVMSYNIHHANPPSQPGTINLDTIAAIINAQSPHFVALQEVDVHTKRSGAGLDQAAYLANKTGMHHFFAKAIDHEGGEYGVAILSKYPIKQGQKYALPNGPGSGDEQRVLATAVVTLPNGKEILFANTHLDHKEGSSSRLLQAKETVCLLKAETRPVILAGDLNDIPSSETVQILKTLFTNSCEACPFTIPQISADRTIDYILFSTGRNWQATDHRVLPETFASDHLPILATLQID